MISTSGDRATARQARSTRSRFPGSFAGPQGCGVTDHFSRVVVPTVDVPAHELLARPLIVAWLGYPLHARFRDRAIAAMQDWARWRLRSTIIGRRPRIEQTLRRLEREVERQMMAGEIFRRQVLAGLPHDPAVFGRTSTKAFSERVAGAIDSSNPVRDFWTKRRPSFALAVGACYGLSARPDLSTLLFGSRPWALRAIDEAEKVRSLAVELDHPSAPHLIKFRAARF